MKLSVIICTHNPREDYFARVLAALAGQTLPQDQWELLIIDNCSDAAIAGRFDLAWRPDVRILREDKLGLTPARLRGIREAAGELLVFVDDDNVLDQDFLEVAERIAAEKTWLGAWSGQCRPGFESEPEAWTQRYWGNLAIRLFDADVWSNLPQLVDTMPCGAGLCLRRSVGLEYVRLHDAGERRFQFDRTGDLLLSGGDNDLAGCACNIGLGLGLISSLTLVHLMPAGRLSEDYLARLAEGIHFSAVMLNAERGIMPGKRELPGRVADWFRLLRLTGPHRTISRAAQRGTRRAAEYLQADR